MVWRCMVLDLDFGARLQTLFERVSRPDLCAAQLCQHPACCALRPLPALPASAAAAAGGGGRMRDGWLRDPAPDEMMHAHYESRAGGFSGADWGDLEYQVALRTG